MNRRGFFGLLAAAAAVPLVPAEIDVGRRIFLPPRGGWLSARPVIQQTTFRVVAHVASDLFGHVGPQLVRLIEQGAQGMPKRWLEMQMTPALAASHYGLKVGDLVSIDMGRGA